MKTEQQFYEFLDLWFDDPEKLTGYDKRRIYEMYSMGATEKQDQILKLLIREKEFLSVDLIIKEMLR